MITSLDNQKIKLIKKVQQKKYRKEYNKLYVEGEHLIQEAYKAGIVDTIFITEKYELDQDGIYYYDELIIPISNIVVEYITEDVANKIALTMNNQGIFGLLNLPTYTQEQLDQASRYLILDGLQDPGNVGTIIRTAKAMNFDAIMLTDDTVDIYNDKVIRATQGAIFKLPIYSMAIADIKQYIITQQIQVYNLMLDGICIREMALPVEQKMALLLGSEGSGVDLNAWKELTLTAITIPMNDQIESLNVAIAGAIAMYECNMKMKA